jgi:hypothetical protein
LVFGMIVISSFLEQPMIQKIPAKRVAVIRVCKRIVGNLGCQKV